MNDNTFTVQDCFDGVVAKLGNRTDIQNDIPKWIRAAVLELGGKFEFDALKTPGPIYQFTPNIAEYDLANWAQPGDLIDDIIALKLFFNGSSGPGFVLKQRASRVVEQLAMTAGMPVYYHRSSATRFMVAQAPVINYSTQMRYQKKNPFSSDKTQWINDTIYFPLDWQQAVEYAASIIGASERRWMEVVQINSQLLYGAPKTKDYAGTPGIIASLVVQQQKDQSHNEHQLNVVVDSYGR